MKRILVWCCQGEAAKSTQHEDRAPPVRSRLNGEANPEVNPEADFRNTQQALHQTDPSIPSPRTSSIVQPSHNGSGHGRTMQEGPASKEPKEDLDTDHFSTASVTSSSGEIGDTSIAITDVKGNDESADEDFPDISEAWANLRLACADFEISYNTFANANTNVLRVDTNSVLRAAQKANEQPDLQISAKTFRTHILSVLEAIETKNKRSEKRWSHRVGVALWHLYPCVRVCLGVAKLAGEARLNVY